MSGVGRYTANFSRTSAGIGMCLSIVPSWAMNPFGKYRLEVVRLDRLARPRVKGGFRERREVSLKVVKMGGQDLGVSRRKTLYQSLVHRLLLGEMESNE